MGKRLLCMVLTLAMFMNFVSMSVFAQTGETVVDSGSMTLEGTDSFGELLTSEIRQQEEEENAYPGGYGIMDLTVEGSTATVEYATLEKAMLVVSIYEEDGIKLLASGRVEADPEETVATVVLTGAVPQYFKATAFLLDAYDHSPLCADYSTPMYTRQMQALLDSTVDDYDADRVLNLDTDKTTNFAVYAEAVKVIDWKDGVNTVVSADPETDTYVIENATDDIVKLKTGEILAYADGDGQLLIVKVGRITVSGSTATIVGGELGIEEVFSYAKIEHTGDEADVVVDDSTAAEGVTFEGLTGGQPLRSVAGGDGFSESLNYKLDKTFKSEDETGTASVSLVGSLDLGLNVDFSFYISTDYQYMKLSNSVSVDLNVTITGEINNELPLGSLKVTFYGVSIGFEPSILVQAEGELEVNIHSAFAIGLVYDSDFGLALYESKPTIEPRGRLEVSLYVGIDMHPVVEILDGLVAKAELEMPVGMRLDAKLVGTKMGDSATEGETVHACGLCVDMELFFKIEALGKIVFLRRDELTRKTERKTKEYKIGAYYWSLDNMEFGSGECPNKKYRVTVQVTDSGGASVAGIHVMAKSDGGQTEQLGSSNSSGIATAYLRPGNYTVTASVDGKTLVKTVKISGEACKVILNTVEKDIFDSKEEYYDYGELVRTGECGAQGNNVIWKLYTDDTLVISGNGAMRDYGMEEPSYGDNIKRVVIQKGVTSIGKWAFSYCERLTSVTIPDSVTSVGEYAFTSCSELTSVTIPESVVHIEDSAFSYCPGLAGVWVDERNPAYSSDSKGTLFNKNKTKLICVSSGVSGSYIIPDSVTSIADEAFYNCEYLTYNRYGGGQYLGKSSNPYFLLVCIDSQDITEFLIHKETRIIGCGAFSGCTNLTAVTIPDSVRSIGSGAFTWCVGLTSVNIPDGVTSIGDDAFSGCTNLTAVTIPDSVRSIGGGAFFKCYNLLSVNIPDSVTSIGSFAFYSCTSLTGIWVDERNPAYSSDSKGVLFNKNKTELIQAPCTLVGDYTIPSGVRSVHDSAFLRSELTSITIPSSVQTIGTEAFSRGTKLTAMTIPSGVTSIGAGAFSWCVGLASVTIPVSVTCIGYSAFYYCTGLSDVYYAGTLQQWNRINVESDNDDLLSATLHIGAAARGAELSVQAAGEDMPVTYSVYGGEITTQTENNQTVKTASFTDLCPGGAYALLVLKRTDAEDILAPENLMYIRQGLADRNGTLSFTYMQRQETQGAYVVACGASYKNLRDARITVPVQLAQEEARPVKLTVTYGGKVLEEGTDYVLTGAVEYTAVGEYTCTVRGVREYTGTVRCTYTVADCLPGDMNGDQLVTDSDAVYLLRNTLFGEDTYPLYAPGDVNGDGNTTDADAVYLLRYTLFGKEQYPLYP